VPEDTSGKVSFLLLNSFFLPASLQLLHPFRYVACFVFPWQDAACYFCCR